MTVKEQATAPTVAPKQNPISTSYCKGKSESSRKSLPGELAEQLGELLFCLQDPALYPRQHQHGWQVFESMLRYGYGL